jgi:hypothetical protein
MEEIQHAIADGRSFTGVLVSYRKDGTPFWNDLTINPVYEDCGKLMNFVGLCSPT